MITIEDSHKKITIDAVSSTYCDSDRVRVFTGICKVFNPLPLDFIKINLNAQTNKYDLHIKTKDLTPRNFRQEWELIGSDVFIIFGNITGKWKVEEFTPITLLRDAAIALIKNDQAVSLEFKIL